jgi:hypothetical protein
VTLRDRVGMTLTARRLRRQAPVREMAAPLFEVDAWVVSRFVVDRLVPVVGVHPFPLNELMLMAAAICRFAPTHVFEWGTYLGTSARVFADTAAHFRIPARIHSIDLPDDVPHPEHPGRARGRLVRGRREVRLHQGDGVDVALRTWAEAGRPDSTLFFLDGDHGYASVRRELEAIMAAVPRPLLLLHDTFFQEPCAGYNVGPHDAIRDVLGQLPQGRLERVDSGMGLPGMTLLYPRQALDPVPGCPASS